MTPSESDRTVTAEGNGDAAGALDRRAGEVDQSPWSAVGSAGLRAVIGRRVSGLSRNGQAMKPLALAGPFRVPTLYGEAAEGSKAPHSKCGVHLRVPWVRIAPSPPSISCCYNLRNCIAN
jgi:hypothetical protein